MIYKLFIKNCIIKSVYKFTKVFKFYFLIIFSLFLFSSTFVFSFDTTAKSAIVYDETTILFFLKNLLINLYHQHQCLN